MAKDDKDKGGGGGRDHVFTIVVNTREKTVEEDELSFREVAGLAFDLTDEDQFKFTITYRKGQGNKPEGTLVEGAVVKLKDGMIFNVVRTTKS